MTSRLPRYEVNCVQRMNVFPMRVGPCAFRCQGNGATACQYIDTTRNATECATTLPLTVFMVALCNRADHYIFILFLSSSFSFFLFFPRLISAVGDWMSAILPHMVHVALVRVYDAGLAGNVGRKKSPKNRRLGTIAQLCRTVSSPLRHVSTIGKKC